MKINNTATAWLLAFVCSGLAFGQSTAGSSAIGGTVRDNFGDGLPDTKVVVTNKSTGLERAASTTDDGVFGAPGLTPGPGYKLSIERTGFKPWESDEFTVPVGQTLRFEIHLQSLTGPESTRGQAGYTAETNKVGVGMLVGNQQIDSLPLIRRRIEPLIALSPLTTADPNQDQIAIDGAPLNLAVLTDGILTGDGYYTLRPFVNATPVDAIQGFEVPAADAPIEFGHTMGGTVNAVTRQGANLFHGSAYSYLRLPGLTARGRFTDGQTLLHARNQSGADIGGPVIHDKLFFFANFEAANDRYVGINRITNQLIADPTANTVLAANCKATTAQCTAAEKYLQPQLNALVPLSSHSIAGVARLDYQWTKDTIVNLSGDLGNALAPNPLQVANAASNGGLLGIKNTRDDSRWAAAGITTALFGQATDQLRLGEWQEHMFQPASASTVSTGTVGIDLSGTPVGDARSYSSLLEERRLQVVNNLTAPAGSHTIQFGIDASTTNFFLNSIDTAPQYEFSSLTNFADDLGSTTLKNYTLLTQSLGKSTRRYPLGEIDFYVQDTWKVLPKLTITGGVRWDKPITPHPGGENTTFYQTATIPSPAIDIIPRLGLAYQYNDKTTFRMGYGFYFAPFTGQLMDGLYLGNALSQANIAISPTQTGAPGFPNGIASFAAIPTYAPEVEFAMGKLRNPHTDQISLAIDRRLDSNTSLTVSAIDSRGFKLLTATDYNLNIPTALVTYTIENAAGTNVGSFQLPVNTARVNTDYSHVYEITNGGSSRYDAVSLDVRRRMTHGITAQAAYTFSHALDDTYGSIVAGGIPLVDPNPRFGSNKGSSPFDQRQRLVVSAIWQPVLTQDKSFFSRYVVNGWTLAPLLTFASGQPVTPTIVANEAAVSGVTPVFPSSIDGTGGSQRVPFLPVGYYRTGAEQNLDLRLSRAIPFTERIRALLSIDFFNSLNSQWTTAVNSVAYTASSGVIKAVPGAGTPAAATSYPYGTNARTAQASLKIVF